MAIPATAAFWIFWAFAFAFCIKVPLWPLHTWLPDAHTEAPTAGSVILAGVLLKMGTYGLMRFNLGLFPEASRESAWLFIRSEEHTSELQSRQYLVCRLLLEKKEVHLHQH